MGLTSCSKYFGDINENPNQPSKVTATVLLPSVEVFYAYGMQGDITRFTSLLMNQIYGADRQFATYQLYSITETDTDNWWKFNHYGGAMMDLKNMMDYAKEGKQTHYLGIAKVLMAYGLMCATDLMGDIPYADAFQGTDNLAPKYQTQEVIYDSIQSLLTQGIANLADPVEVLSEPGTEDLLYSGDLGSWTKFAHVLKARAYLHLGRRNPANYNLAIAELANGFVNSNDDAHFFFGETETSASPWYQYNDQRADILFEGFILDTMTAMNDPRLSVYYAPDGWLGDYFTSTNSPYFFASYMEMQFILAEANFETGATSAALTAYNDGIVASLSRYGLTPDSTFTADVLSETTASLTLEKIMLQKYIAMYLDPEVFTDWRRTGFPRLTPTAGALTQGGVIPTRLPYPQSERLFNPNMPADNSITGKVWWDI
jgi:Starch-binding associating with outer membrane